MYQPSKELTNVPNIVELPRWKWLADAIREGSKRTTQCYRAYWVCKPAREGGEVYATCALGAAALVLFSQGDMNEKVGNLTNRIRNWSGGLRGRGENALMLQIIRWSDDLHWTRERIADELEKL